MTARGRDLLGRPVPAGDARAVPPVPEQALPAREALRLLDGVGHFPHQEAPDVVTAALLAHDAR